MKTKAMAEAQVKTDKAEAEVHAQLLPCNDLPTGQRALIASDLRLVEAVDKEIDMLERALRQEAWRTPASGCC